MEKYSKKVYLSTNIKEKKNYVIKKLRMTEIREKEKKNIENEVN